MLFRVSIILASLALTYGLPTTGVSEALSFAKVFLDSIAGSHDRKAQLQLPQGLDNPTTSMVIGYGYPIEVHHAITEDGYILELHRIPRGRDNPSSHGTPILLAHGLTSSSAHWVITGPDYGLPFLLAEAGYDVWMGNVRGNAYSKGHMNPSMSRKDFWEFSIDEHGRYDAPAMVDKILEVTGRSQTLYLGHSMGGGMFFVAMDYHGAAFGNKISGMFGLAPATQISHLISPIRDLAPYAEAIDAWLEENGMFRFVPETDLLRVLAIYCLEGQAEIRQWCYDLVHDYTGTTAESMDPAIIPVLIGHYPQGTSAKNVVHFAQNVLKDGFARYDYGPAGNMENYGQAEPPQYDVSKANVPIHVYYGDADRLVVPQDVQWLVNQLPNLAGNTRVNDPLFGHIDFLFNSNVDVLLYNDIIAKANDLSGV